MKTKNILLIGLFFILLSINVFSISKCENTIPMGEYCYDDVRILTNCNYVDVYDNNSVFYDQFPMIYEKGSYYFNYTLLITKSGSYILQFCDERTYAYVDVYDTSPNRYLHLNNSFLRGNDTLNISYYINITNDTILTTDLFLVQPDGTIYSDDSIMPENSVKGNLITNNPTLASVQTGYWTTKLDIVGTSFNYIITEEFKVNSLNTSLPFCDVTNISYDYTIPKYCDLNQNCYVIFRPSLTSQQSLNATAFMIINGTNYNMFYDKNSNYWYSIIKTNKSEDITAKLFVSYDDGVQTLCSEIPTGTIKFRKAFYVDVSLFKKSFFNSSISYKNKFDYLYLIYTNTSPTTSPKIANSFDSMNRFLGGLKSVNKNVYKVDMKMKDYNFDTYFWAYYDNGDAKIKLYETGYYDLYVVNSNSKLNISFKEFERPAIESSLNYDNQLYKGVYLNQTDSWDLLTSSFSINWFDIVKKVLLTILIIFIMLAIHYVLCMLPEPMGVQMSGIAMFFTIPLSIFFIILTWWF